MENNNACGSIFCTRNLTALSRTIARALSNSPEILLLDEPTGDLDTFNTVEIMNLLLKINLENKTTCVMVTHNPDVECYADRLLYIQDGRFVKQAINSAQSQLIYEYYSGMIPPRLTRSTLEYLKSKDNGTD